MTPPEKFIQHIILVSMEMRFDDACAEFCEGCTMIGPDNPEKNGCPIYDIRVKIVKMKDALEEEGVAKRIG